MHIQVTYTCVDRIVKCWLRRLIRPENMTRMEEIKNTYIIFVRKLVGKICFEDQKEERIIKKYLMETGFETAR
jgi:hypothetical protein